MNIEELKNEMKRLSRINDTLEENIFVGKVIRIDILERIQKNSLTMCEIAKELK